MWTLIKLALRNLARNKIRTGLTIGAIAAGMTVFMFLITLATGSYQEMVRLTISNQAGHVVVQPLGWQDEREPTILMADARDVDRRITEVAPDAIVTQRILMGGSLMSSSTSAIAALAGFEPNDEAKIIELDDKIVEGEWLNEEDARGAVIGVDMAKRLDVDLGDKLVFMSQQKGQSEMQSRLMRVRGIFRTGAPTMDNTLVGVHIDAARALLESEAGANQVAAHLVDPDQADALAPLVADAVAGVDEVEALHWRDAVPEILAMIAIDKQSNDAIMFIMIIIVCMGVLNAILMSVLERTRELGVMMAIGMPKRHLAGMILFEGLFLGVLGAALGVILGWFPANYLVTEGLDMSGMMGGQDTMETAGIAISAHIMGGWDWPRIFQYAAGISLFTLFSAAWPAWKVSTLKPVDAMRHH